MNLLYGVVGEGMGHATRSLVVLTHLLERGHRIRVVVSGKAHRYLREQLRAQPSAQVEEIEGMTLRYFANRIDRAGSLFWNLRNAPRLIRKNIKVYRRVAEDGFAPDAVVSDFESFAALYALRHQIPAVSIDNMQILNRCKIDRSVRKGKGFDFRVARLAVKSKMPGAYHYLITSFFFPPVRRRRTTLVPPILRPEVVAAERAPGSHILIYQRAVSDDALVAMLRGLPHTFKAYGASEQRTEENVEFLPFSGSGFLENLRTARAVIGGAGFSLMSEAVSLGAPMLAVPIDGQYEQELNARSLAGLGYGAWTRRLSRKSVVDFLARLESHEEALSEFTRRDNSMLFACLDELLQRVANNRKRPNRLKSPAIGKWMSRKSKRDVDDA